MGHNYLSVRTSPAGNARAGKGEWSRLQWPTMGRVSIEALSRRSDHGRRKGQ
jgi:hypothetical protein